VHTQDRHVSVRLPTDLYERVQAIAGTRGESVSQVLRRLVSESIARLDHPDAGAIDTANAALQELRRHSA